MVQEISSIKEDAESSENGIYEKKFGEVAKEIEKALSYEPSDESRRETLDLLEESIGIRGLLHEDNITLLEEQHRSKGPRPAVIDQLKLNIGIKRDILASTDRGIDIKNRAVLRALHNGIVSLVKASCEEFDETIDHELTALRDIDSILSELRK